MKGSTALFFEVLLILVILFLLWFFITQTYARAMKREKVVVGNSEEAARSLAKLMNDCWKTYGREKQFAKCDEFPINITNGRLNKSSVLLLSECRCSIDWREDENFTKGKINYNGFNNTLEVWLIK